MIISKLVYLHHQSLFHPNTSINKQSTPISILLKLREFFNDLTGRGFSSVLSELLYSPSVRVSSFFRFDSKVR